MEERVQRFTVRPYEKLSIGARKRFEINGTAQHIVPISEESISLAEQYYQRFDGLLDDELLRRFSVEIVDVAKHALLYGRLTEERFMDLYRRVLEPGESQRPPRT